jgi:hypothetical protein
MVFGGEEHTGWLPPSAVVPKSTLEHRVDLDVALEFDCAGYLLEWFPSPGQNVGAESPFAGDLWFDDLASALDWLRQTFAIDRRYRWQESDRSPTAVRNGMERRYDGAISALVHECRAVTLLTPSGREVEVRRLRTAADGSWEGVVQRAAAGSDAPPVGSYVSFREAEVHSATV